MAAPQGVPDLDGPPVLPPHVPQLFKQLTRAAAEARYFPLLLGVADVHYSSKTHGVEEGRRVTRIVAPVEGPIPIAWAEGEESTVDLAELERRPSAGVSFAPVPDIPLDAKSAKE